VEGRHHNLVDAVVGHVDRPHAEDRLRIAVPPRQPVLGASLPLLLLLFLVVVLQRLHSFGYRCPFGK
jgi:hypothetical protein